MNEALFTDFGGHRNSRHINRCDTLETCPTAVLEVLLQLSQLHMVVRAKTLRLL